MPEQLTKHPEVTLQVLRSSGAQCGEGLAPAILTRCPADRFCKLPGGELCVFGLAEAPRMTQISAAEWSALAAPATPAADHRAEAGTVVPLASAALGLLLGLAVGYALARSRPARLP